FFEAANEVLREARHPLHFKEITELAIKKNLLSHVGRTPEVTMDARLVQELQCASVDTDIVKARPGVYALREWNGRTPADDDEPVHDEVASQRRRRRRRRPDDVDGEDDHDAETVLSPVDLYAGEDDFDADAEDDEEDFDEASDEGSGSEEGRGRRRRRRRRRKRDDEVRDPAPTLDVVASSVDLPIVEGAT